MMDIFSRQYGCLDNLFADYATGEEYGKNSLVKEVNDFSSTAINNALASCKHGHYDDASNAMLEGMVAHEELGFLLGFSYAMRIAQESMKR